MVAAMSRFQHLRRVENLGHCSRSANLRNGSLPSQCEELIFVVLLTKDKVSCEISHQADVTGDTKFQSGPDLTQRPHVMVVHRIYGPILPLGVDDTHGVDVLFIEK